MSASILVAHAAQQRSTLDVAGVIAAALRKAGLEVDIKPTETVESLEGYAGVVVGAPLRLVRWDKGGRAFLERHQRALSERPAAVFAIGPFPDRKKAHGQAQAQLDSELAQFPSLRPVAVQVFGFKFDPAHFGRRYWLMPRWKRMPTSEMRHWTEIGDWGKELAGKLAHAQPPPAE